MNIDFIEDLNYNQLYECKKATKEIAWEFFSNSYNAFNIIDQIINNEHWTFIQKCPESFKSFLIKIKQDIQWNQFLRTGNKDPNFIEWEDFESSLRLFNDFINLASIQLNKQDRQMIDETLKYYTTKKEKEYKQLADFSMFDLSRVNNKTGTIKKRKKNG